MIFRSEVVDIERPFITQHIIFQYTDMSAGLIANFLVDSVLATAQSEITARQSNEQSRTLADAERQQDAGFHTNSMKLMTQLFNEQCHNEWVTHDAGMMIAVNIAMREAMRDVRHQRQLLNQTVLVCDTLMFSCAFLSISQPQFNEPDLLFTPVWLSYLLSSSSGLSVLLLTASVWAAFKMQSRLGGYHYVTKEQVQRVVYTCGNVHTDFNSYFTCHCEWLRLLSLVTFFGGTVAVLASAVAIHIIQDVGRLDDPISAIMFTSVICVSIVAIIVFEFVADDNTEAATEYGGGAGPVTSGETEAQQG